jgi:ribonuclease E
MASPDDARVDEARDQSTVPASPSTTSAPSDEPSSAPQRRPRGAASFPGGPPPASPAPADLPAAPAPAPEPSPPPQFQVTTVEPSAASFPGGPPPPAPPPRDDPPRVTTARAEAVTQPPAPPQAPSAPERPETPEPATPVQRQEAPTPPVAPERPEDQADGGPQTGPAGGSDGAQAGQVEEAPAGRTGSRRRRRGGRGRGAGAPAATSGETADPDPTAAQTPPPDAVPAAVTGLGGPTPRDLAAAADPAAGGPTSTGDGPAVAGADVDPGEATAPTSGGSARTRARRRRRAAAKARGQDAVADGDATEAADLGVVADEASPTSAAEGAPVDEAGRPARPAADASQGGRTRTRGGPAGDETTQAAPSGGVQAERADQTQPTAAPSRTSRSRRRSGGGGNGEAQQARPANGDPQPADGDAQAGAGTRISGERGTGRGRRRGRGGARLVAVEADAATTTPDAPEGEARESQGGGRGRPGGSGSERSTRLETRSRREGARQADRGRRRRPSGLTEEQKRILREEGPERRMIVTEGAERTQIGVLEGPTLVEHYVTRKSGRSMVGNIYLGRVQNVLPGMEAAFVDIGRGRNAVLYAGEVNYNEEDLDGEAPRIEKVLKPGQPVLVQVTKDPIGAKGARLTAQVSLAGRYLVLQPEDNTFGISRRLPEAERDRLRDILKEVRPKGLGLIVRTAAEGASADDLRADLARLQARWETVERKAKKASAPAAIYSEPELVVRVIRDIFSPDFVELVVDGDELYQRVEEYLTEVAPDLLPKLHKHQGKLPVFEHYRVVEQIHKALERKVWLPSGGSIVIDRTEAMTVIDVNTGKFVGKANLEETVVANNLEAADEIVRQLRLRDIGGIIIIDFIDMLFERNQQAVVDRLRAALVRDKTKSQVMEVSSLGLVQMTRKRVSGGLLDSFSETCPTCDGRGVVITHEIQ